MGRVHVAIVGDSTKILVRKGSVLYNTVTMSLPKFGEHHGHEEPNTERLSPRDAIEVLTRLRREGVTTITSVRPNGERATRNITKSPLTGAIEEIRDPRNTIEYAKK